MKKIIIFIVVILLVIIFYVFMYNRKINYKLDYKVNDIAVTEEYILDKEYYKFIIKYENYDYTFILNNKYSSKRKHVEDIKIDKKDDYTCATIKVNSLYLPSICRNKKNIVDGYIAGINKKSKDNKINTINKIDVFSKDNNYYIWNGYGITNVLTKKKFNFLKKEDYDNSFSYSFKNYIIFGNYDETREYTKLYMFDENDNGSISEIKLENPISTDSYFNGNIDDDVYIFDKKNKIQYKLDVKSRKISITSTDDFAVNYDGEKNEQRLNDFIYSNIFFNYNNYINYFIKDNKLYYKFYDENDSILIDDRDIKDIIKIEDDKIYYLVGASLYSYSRENGPKKLLDYFEWNFSYKSKLFIF